AVLTGPGPADRSPIRTEFLVCSWTCSLGCVDWPRATAVLIQAMYATKAKRTSFMTGPRQEWRDRTHNHKIDISLRRPKPSPRNRDTFFERVSGRRGGLAA